jgi:hypothetical protein
MDVGSKVICIDASIAAHTVEEINDCFQQWVTKDKIYTVRAILDNNGLVTSILLEELHNIPRYFPKTIGRMQEPSFKIDRFREIDTAEFYEKTTATEKLELTN